VNIGTFYLYNNLTGLYRTTNGGDTWTLVHSGEIVPWSEWNMKLAAVPGNAGHLFATAGNMDGAPTSPFRRSTNGGATWTDVPNVAEVHAFGFGKAAAGANYPTIFIAGWVNGSYGIWRSVDNAGSWTKIGDYPTGSIDSIVSVEGDKNTFGTVYVGFSGSGAAIGVESGDATTTTVPTTAPTTTTTVKPTTTVPPTTTTTVPPTTVPPTTTTTVPPTTVPPTTTTTVKPTTTTTAPVTTTTVRPPTTTVPPTTTTTVKPTTTVGETTTTTVKPGAKCNPKRRVCQWAMSWSGVWLRSWSWANVWTAILKALNL
jgi:hypothetical protein